MSAASGQRGEAVALWDRAAEVNPYNADYARRLAELHSEAGDWPEAARAARAALARDISLLETRVILVEALRRIGDREGWLGVGIGTPYARLRLTPNG